MTSADQKLTLGWREWLSLPDLGIGSIKAKLDTGARTSALHVFYLERFCEGDTPWVHFGVHPLQKNARKEVYCRAPVADERWVSDSGGHREWRMVIETRICAGEWCWPLELSLTNRDNMRFRMLLGRTAMVQRLRVDPAASYRLGRPSKRKE